MKCPHPEHTGSRVKLDGTYGKPGHRRQRYKCTPRRGRPHVFTELLPREEAWHGSCEHCERHLERREGPKAPRNYHFVARGIAEALLAVGAGTTYMQASRVARDRARRFRVDGETGELRESDHGQLVADWVELFAPVVFEPHRPAFWPPEGSLLLDHLPFRVRALDANGKRIPAGRVAFDAFCAVGYQAGKPRLWRAEAFTSAHPANWSAGPPLSFTSASGTCDMHSAACSPRSSETTPARSWRSSAPAPRARSPAPPSGAPSLAPRGPPRTRASIAGSPSTIRSSSGSSPAVGALQIARPTCR